MNCWADHLLQMLVLAGSSFTRIGSKSSKRGRSGLSREGANRLPKLSGAREGPIRSRGEGNLCSGHGAAQRVYLEVESTKRPLGGSN